MQEKIQQELEALVTDGRGVAKHTRFMGMNRLNVVEVSDAQNKYQAFKTRALNLVRRAFGVESDHYQELQKLGNRLNAGDSEFTEYPACLGIVEAAQHDFDAGLLFDMRALIGAELLGDFIEQAATLQAAGYHVPAASLAGAVLEDTLRKLWIRNKWTLPKKSSINSLSAELAKAQSYNSLTQKQITANAEIRNNADHGHYERIKPADVDGMVKWIRRFAEEQLR